MTGASGETGTAGGQASRPPLAPGSVVRVLVVAPTRLYREGLEEVLSRRDGVEVVAVAPPGPRACQLARDLAPDIVLADIPPGEGLRAVGELAEAAPAGRVVALAIPETRDDVVACIRAGACGYVRIDASVDELVATLHAVAEGGMLCSPAIVGALIAEVGSRPAPLGPLTQREAEILDLIEQGLSNKEIARVLYIQLATVKNHVHHILEKLEARGRGEAAAQLRRHRALEPTAG